MNWIQSLLMGFVGGLCEPMPLSGEAHRGFLRYCFGLASEDPLFLLTSRIAVLAVLLAIGRLELMRLHRTAKQLRTAGHHRSSHPNLNQSGTLRLLRLALPPAILGRMLMPRLSFIADTLWLLPVTLFLGGLIGWLPTHFRTGNRDGRHLTPVDGLLMGLAAALGAVPGISPVGAVLAVGSICGLHRPYAVRVAWLLHAAGLVTAIVMDLLTLASAGFPIEPAQILPALLGAAAAAAGAFVSIRTVLSLARPGGWGFSGFSFYNWGLALLCLVLFLLV